MEKALAGKQILIVEDESVFSSLLAGYLRTLGAKVLVASNGAIALQILGREAHIELILCDLDMPVMNGIEFVAKLTNEGINIPVIIISATNKMAEVDEVLRLGAKDVLLKPVADLNEIKKAVLAYLHPTVFMSGAIEQNNLNKDWLTLKHNSDEALNMLKQLQPPVSQVIAHCKVNYRKLNMIDKPGLILDMAALSDNELAFYCLDISRSTEYGVISALLLRVAFNSLLQEHITHHSRRLPSMAGILNRINNLLGNAGLQGQFPLLLGYYHTINKTVLLTSAGLHASIKSGNRQIQLDSGVPLGTLRTICSNQVCSHSAEWQCRIWNTDSQIKLMLSSMYSG
ncbi:two-component system response regulator RssB [Photorhabdus khanii]|uniref:Regulator of RpoS n=1 Tax=Photorhabdus khanii subsp. guanajuatensis TaxID=2100166 RepID=A0A4R4K668_9GAMM|nr:two-component system response regulator RssB [Photorhabdus khanii]TDB63007.1 two-component system response regulator RssB [Photorhabdus khanii subsp. guanajuatensis]